MSADTAERARHEALRTYAAAHDAWCEQEQLLLLSGRDVEAAGAHAMALAALRAWDAEARDPEPEGLS